MPRILYLYCFVLATSATLKSIDLITNIVSPILTGQIMTYASVGIGALFIAGWNFVSLFVEYYLLWKVYNVVPALRARKDLSRIQKGLLLKHNCTLDVR